LYILFSADVEDQVCPVLMQLTAGDSSDDYRSEAVTVSTHGIKTNMSQVNEF
jgi:hypothetical protein